MNIPYINVNDPIGNLNFEAQFQLNGITKYIYVFGKLNKISSNGIISCLLTLDFNFILSDFGIIPPKGFSNLATVQIVQILMNRY